MIYLEVFNCKFD